MRGISKRRLALVLTLVALAAGVLASQAGARPARSQGTCSGSVGTPFTVGTNVKYTWSIAGSCGTASVDVWMQRFVAGQWTNYITDHPYQLGTPAGPFTDQWGCGPGGHASYRGKLGVNGIAYFGAGLANC